jgi:DNA-directed RNA polymerase subunit RPC12/RpoP
MIKFKCSNCNHQINAPEKYAGKRVRCPKCKAPIHVPKSVGKTGTQEPKLIKFCCPKCNQKIGLAQHYAGKRVRCAKCKNPLRVPQASSRAERPVVKDETAVLRAGQEQRPAEEGIWGDLGSMDELLLEETKAPSVERQAPFDHGESEFSEYTSQSPQPGSLAESRVTGERPRKKRSTILIGAACVLVLLLVGIVIWSFVSKSEVPSNDMEARLPKVQEFAADYIDLLSEGKIDEARELLSPELQIDVQTDEIERFAEQIGKSEIIQLDCKQTHFEKYPEGDQIFLWYNLRYEDNEQTVIISVMAIDEELRVNGIAAQEPSGTTVSIGQSSYEELLGIILAAEFKKFGSIFVKFFRVFFIAIIILGLIQTISMWIVFEKAGQPGWAAIVPYYNMWVLAEVGDKPGWLGLLFCFGGAIPFIGPLVVLVLWAVISIGVARAFGRGIGFGIGLTIIPFVFYPILAFASD